jgi:hypothetical protein
MRPSGICPAWSCDKRFKLSCVYERSEREIKLKITVPLRVAQFRAEIGAFADLAVGLHRLQ